MTTWCFSRVSTAQAFCLPVSRLPGPMKLPSSPPTDKPLGYAGLESIARRHLPSNRPFFLLGESFSGPIAVSIAASRPPGLLGVILCCSFARNPMPHLAAARPLVRFFPFGVVPVSWFSPLLLGRFSSPALHSTLAGAVASVVPAVLRERARAALTADVSALLSRIEVPILYLRASEDRVVSKSASDLIASQVPDTRVVDFTAPHLLLQVVPAAAASAVSAFMRLVTSGPGLAANAQRVDQTTDRFSAALTPRNDA